MVVQCTWKSNDGRPIADAVTWSEGSESVDLEDEVKAENCLLLKAPDNGASGYLTVPACQLLLSCQPPTQIQHVSVLSEARVLEVYGHHGEYLKTIRNDLIEVVEDMAVFKGDIMLERPLNVCSIKFACLRSKNEMWLYGVSVTLDKAINVMPDQMKINLAEVELRLGEIGLKLSDKAEAFKQLFERCQTSPEFNQQDVGSIVSLLQMSNLIKEKTVSPEQALSPHALQDSVDNNNSSVNLEALKNMTNDLLSNRMVSPYESVQANISTPSTAVKRNTIETQTDEVYPGLEERLNAYIDEKIKDLDKCLWDKVQKRFNEAEAKLMCKLEEIESFVKPHGVP